jgi:molybdopterin converting factor small subunit
MKIALETSFNLNNAIDFETQNATLSTLLEELSANYRPEEAESFEFFDSKRKEVYPEWVVHVNGQPYEDLSAGLNTVLKDRDKVGIYLVIPGG